MAVRYLLDTSVAQDHFQNDREIRRRLKGVVSFLSVVVAGELYHGAFNSQDKARNLQHVREFLSLYELLLCDHTTAERFGRIATDLRARGLHIPQNDIWIAAQAMQYGLTLATRDPKHMGMIAGLTWEQW